MVIGGHAIRLLASARGTTGRRLSPSGDPVSHFVKHLAIKYGFAVGSCDSSLISEPHLLWLYICMLPCFSEVTVRGLMGILWDHRELSTICTLGLLGTQGNVSILSLLPILLRGVAYTYLVFIPSCTTNSGAVLSAMECSSLLTAYHVALVTSLAVMTHVGLRR